MSRLAKFAQPSEVGEPIELLRAGLIFHARGLINTRAIQNNLDWIWPYWVERQFNPKDISFIPRAFSISHINLSHRNWTAIGIPDCPYLPIVDPSGLLTPYYDGWSLDIWIIPDCGNPYFPSKSKEARQEWKLLPDRLSLKTKFEDINSGIFLVSNIEVNERDGQAYCRMNLKCKLKDAGWLAVSLRPYNPEGISFIHEIDLDASRRNWKVNGFPAIHFSEAATKHFSSEYHIGDVFHKVMQDGVHKAKEDMGSKCKVGLATAASMFAINANEERSLEVTINLAGDIESKKQIPGKPSLVSWPVALSGLAQLKIPDEKMQFLYNAAIRSLILHSPGEVFPGPYTYKRFWFRDAAFLINAMLGIGLEKRCERVLDLFSKKQTRKGYFLSQEGEWDSNGEALWIMNRFCQVTGCKPKSEWIHSIVKATHWIISKRNRKPNDLRLHGLFPAGFSAEHLGPNDFYYWDDFWGVAGLQAAGAMLAGSKENETGVLAYAQALDFMSSIEISLKEAQKNQSLNGAIPASPLRRMDPGAIGSLAVTYPLALWPVSDSRVKATLEFLLAKCMFKGGFFQDMIHSGINAYLTLHMAQALLRAGDLRYFQLIRDTANLATSTGQWPEAIHPNTLGGCMGDGHHVWASAEWVLMMRSLFIREEGDDLILCSGLPEEWLTSGKEMLFGPSPGIFGTITIRVMPTQMGLKVSWSGHWHAKPKSIIVKIMNRTVLVFKDIQDGEVVIPH